MAQSRVEAILKQGKSYTGRPLSRVEKLLKDLVIDGGGGGGVPSDEDDFEPMDIDDIMSVISTDNGEEPDTQNP